MTHGFASFAVHVVDGLVDLLVEVVDGLEGSVGQMMPLEVPPASFDVVEFGGIFGQPFAGEPGG